MQKISTMQAFSNEILKEPKLTIGVDLGDRSRISQVWHGTVPPGDNELIKRGIA